jgi:hypothetical protein
VLALAADAACAATPPYVQLVGAVGTLAIPPATCSGAGPPPSFFATIDLGSGGAYRYSPAAVMPYFFDDEGEFNLVYNQDVTLLVSTYFVAPIAQSNQPFPVVPVSKWYAAIDRVPEHTELALRVATYDATGITVATSRLTWDCTTGEVLSLEHRGNAAPPATTRLVEFYHATLDHYFVSADPAEIGLLDAATITGWTRTGHGFNVWTTAASGANPVCRFYLPPAFGDSHFYSAGLRIAERFFRESAGAGDRHLPARHASRLSPVESTQRFQPPLHGGPARESGDGGQRISRGGLRAQRGNYVRADVTYTNCGRDRFAVGCAICARRKSARKASGGRALFAS